MEADQYADHQNIHYEAEHDSLRNANAHLDRLAEAHKMAAAAKANEADSEVLTGFSNILNKIGKFCSIRKSGVRKCSEVQKISVLSPLQLTKCVLFIVLLQVR